MSVPDRIVRAGQVWRNWKGINYFVVAVSRHTETNEELVTYRKCNDSRDFWTRSLNMFLDEAGPGIKRFVRVR